MFLATTHQYKDTAHSIKLKQTCSYISSVLVIVCKDAPVYVSYPLRASQSEHLEEVIRYAQLNTIRSDIHRYIHTYTHTYIHTYIHTYMWDVEAPWLRR